MQLPDDVRQSLASEFRFAAQHIADADALAAQLFFFSVFFSATNRAFNQTWSDELALLHLVPQSVHRELNGIIATAVSGQTLQGVPNELSEELAKVSDELAQVFESDQIDAGTLYPVLARLAEIGYVSTGNGRYLHLRGRIKLSGGL